MKSSEILTLAAELVDSGGKHIFFRAIDLCCANDDDMDKASSVVIECYGEYVYFGENQQHRVIALLLCAAIAEMEGD